MQFKSIYFVACTHTTTDPCQIQYAPIDMNILQRGNEILSTYLSDNANVQLAEASEKYEYICYQCDSRIRRYRSKAGLFRLQNSSTHG